MHDLQTNNQNKSEVIELLATGFRNPFFTD